jgi:hypothetical protein
MPDVRAALEGSLRWAISAERAAITELAKQMLRDPVTVAEKRIVRAGRAVAR